jgi:hypothetical protein
MAVCPRTDRIHLTTGANTRAQGFYAATGWTFTGIDAHGDAAFAEPRHSLVYDYRPSNQPVR